LTSDDDSRVPCCQLDAARRVKRIYLDGTAIGISRFDDIITEVAELELEDEEQIKSELVVRIKKFNYVPSGAEEAYAEAALDVFLGTVGKERKGEKKEDRCACCE
jgi:hypothetical protein